MKHNKLLGQNFIYDKSLLAKIVNVAGDIKKYNVLEIGGGVGTLTRAILEASPISLSTIEIDSRFSIKHETLKYDYSNYNYINDDVLKCNIQDIIEKPAIIISNLPYNISSVLLLKMLEQINQVNHFDFFVLMFQKEVAQRLIAKPRTKNYGILSVLTQLLCEVSYEFEVKAESFVPPPKVQSAVVKITPYREPKYQFNDHVIKKILRLGFSQRRKMIKTSLASIFNDEQKMFQNLEECQISERSRIEEVEVAKLAKLSILIHSR